MGVRKNAKYLTATERENLVRAFVMMKADPVPGRPYNWYEAFVLIHRYRRVTALLCPKVHTITTTQTHPRKSTARPIMATMMAATVRSRSISNAY